MEVESPPTATPSILPPGCRFRPSDHQLLSDYLAPKNFDPAGCSHLIIGEIDFHDLGPSQLPDSAMFLFGSMGRRQHWFCFAKRNRQGKIRVVDGRGRWRRKGKAKDVVVEGKVLGTRTGFVFYEMGDSGDVVRTDWFLHEYALAAGSDETYKIFSLVVYEAPFVLCRVFRKFRARNCISQGGMNPNGGPSASAIYHGDFTIDGDSCLVGDSTIGSIINVGALELNVHIISGPAAPAVEPVELVRSPEIIPSAALGENDSAAREIMEEDFLELDDLDEPL